MALQSQSRPEPMNATPHHSKVKVSVTLSDPFYIAGNAITGKMELESRADKGLGLGVIMVELVAIEELTSRDHSATSTFLHTHRIFQGPSLPPSNAVLPHPIAGEAPLPAHYHRARRGVTTFLFRLPLPPSSPPSIDFGNGLARIRYEVRASIGVAWKDQNRLVTDRCPVDVLQRYPDDDATHEEGGIYSDLWPAPEGLVVGEGGKIWVQARVLGGMLVAGESACVELQVKNHSAKKTTGLHVTLSRQLHLPTSANTTGRKTLPPLQISDTLASIAFRGPEYVTHPGTEGIAQLMFDVPPAARTVSAHPRHGGDADEDEEESDVLKMHTPLFEVRGIVAVRMAMPLGSKDIVLELPVAVFHRASLPPPPPEPYPYPAPDPYSDVHHSSSTSPPPPGLASPTLLMSYADQAQSPFYAYPTPPPALPLLPQSIPAPLSTQLIIPPYRAHDGQLWFPSPPPTCIGSPYYNQYPPQRPASVNATIPELSTLLSGLPVSGAPDQPQPSFPYQQQQYAPLPEQATGHGARAARISHHLRATSRARSVSPSPAQLTPPTPVGLDVLAPKPMPSPKIITEMQSIVDDDDPFSRSFGRVSTRTRSLSVVRLEEMAARAAAELEAKARAEKDEGTAADKTLPAPPVPSGKLPGYGPNRRLVAQEIFQQQEHVQEEGRREEAEADADAVPRTPSLSALSLLRPLPRHERPVFSSYGAQGEMESGLDALERHLLEQVGTRKHPPLPPEMGAVPSPVSATAPPPPPLSVPLPVPGKLVAQEQAGEVGAGAAVNESAISSLALGAEEDFGGRKANFNITPPSVEGEGEEEAEAEAEDADADGRTQRQGKGAGASSGSERGTHKARSRKSAKSDSKEKDREKDKERKGKKRKDKRDDEAARLKRAAKGRVAEWLGNLEAPEPVPEPVPELEVAPEVNAVQDRLSPPKLAPAPPVDPAPTSATAALPVVESEPNPRSSGFIPVSTLRRAPISLPPASGSPATPAATCDVTPALAPVRRLAQKYPHNLPVEVKYDVKSARGGRGGRVTAVASIWAEAAKSAGPGAATPTRARPDGPAKGNAPRSRTSAANRLTPSPTPIKPMTSIVDPVRAAPVPAKAPRLRQTPPAAKGDDRRVVSAAASTGKERDSPRPPRTLFGLGSAAAATPSSPALSSSIATPVLSSTASLARPPLNPASAPPPANRNTPPQSSSPLPPQPQPLPSPAAAGQRPPMVNGGGFKAELAFGQARLRDLIKRYQGQAP